MKAGDYVRTKWRIAKITSLNVYCNLVVETERGNIDRDKIIKSSPNLIDLIEVGDYVNGKEITQVIPPDICGDEELTDKKVYINDFEVYEEWIKSIVTKEQFESMEYKVC